MTKVAKHTYRFLNDGGETGKYIRSFDWAATSLGDMELWPQVLRAALGIMLNSKFPMCLMWGEDLIFFYNDAFRASLGNDGKHPAAIGQKSEDVWAEIWAHTGPLIRQVMETGIATWSENQVLPIYRNGKLEDVYWTYSYSPVFDENDEPAGVFVTCKETTHENKIKQSEKNVRDLFEQAPALIGILRGKEGKCDLFNPMFTKLWGNRDVLNKPMREAWPELEGQGFFEIIDQVFDENKPVHLPEYAAIADWNNDNTSKERFFNFIFTPYHDSTGFVDGVMIFGYDITEAVFARKQTEKGKQELEELANAVPQLVWIAEPDGSVNYYNNRVSEFAGAQKLPDGKWQWDNMLVEEDKEPTINAWKEATQTGSVYEKEHRIKMNDGSYKWFLSRAYPYKDETGNIIKWFGTATDIDHQKQTAERLEQSIQERTKDLMQANANLERSNRELEKFAYVASHDLQEPLRKIKAFGDILKNRYREALSKEGADMIDRMQSASERMGNLIEDLLIFSRVSSKPVRHEEINLKNVISEVLMDLETAINDKKAIIKISNLSPLSADSLQLRQMFQNLIGNSLKFAKNDVTPEIIISSKIITGKDAGMEIPDAERNKIFQLIEIKDNGIGFEQQYADKIFQIFQRLHGRMEYSGSGIGLSIVQKVIENHHGYIVAEGVPDKGATFKILLPQ